jgi:hypothetical protein
MAQYNGVWCSMDFCCNNEEKLMSYAWHASEQLSRMSEAVGVGGFCFTTSRIRFSVVECTVCFVALDGPELNQLERPLFVVVEVNLPEYGVIEGFLLRLDEDCANDGGVIRFDVFSS